MRFQHPMSLRNVRMCTYNLSLQTCCVVSTTRAFWRRSRPSLSRVTSRARVVDCQAVVIGVGAVLLLDGIDPVNKRLLTPALVDAQSGELTAMRAAGLSTVSMLKMLVRIASGVVLITAINRFAFRDPHYHLPLINYLPRPVAELLIDVAGRSKRRDGECHRADVLHLAASVILGHYAITHAQLFSAGDRVAASSPQSGPSCHTTEPSRATIAGVDDTVGGSPTPFAPSGACGSGSSTRDMTTSGMSSIVGSRSTCRTGVATVVPRAG